MPSYVLGFLIDENRYVALVRKKKGPGGQKGRLNGFGGHIRPDETPEEAMHREFIEESGWPGSPAWYPMPPMRGPDWLVYCFWTEHTFMYLFDGQEDVERYRLARFTQPGSAPATVKNVRAWLRKVEEAANLLEHIRKRDG
jgi:8-oxo-dGTP pyrophosphatase MutT (NUDIX family)